MRGGGGGGVDNTDNAKLLRQLNWLNVPQLIDFETVSLMYKIENGLVPAHLKQMFVKSEDMHSYDTRSANPGNFHLPKRRLNIGQTAFSFHGASLWNQLRCEIKKAQSLESLQKLMKGYIMNQQGFFLFRFTFLFFFYLSQILSFLAL